MPNKLCESCANWKRFKERCWFFWEDKKVCTQFVVAEGEEPAYKAIDQ